MSELDYHLGNTQYNIALKFLHETRDSVKRGIACLLHMSEMPNSDMQLYDDHMELYKDIIIEAEKTSVVLKSMSKIQSDKLKGMYDCMLDEIILEVTAEEMKK